MREMSYGFGEVIEIDGCETEKIVAAESTNRRHRFAIFRVD